MNQDREQISADKMLLRVRNLLDKAASTKFEAEALAFTAKAHQLMEDYAISLAQVEAAKDPNVRRKPVTVILKLMDYYTQRRYFDAQSSLLSVLCSHNRCYSWTMAVYSQYHIAGFESDVRFVELLFTSLWEQMESRFRTDVVIEPKYNSKAKKGKVKFVAINKDVLAASERGPNYRYEYLRGFTERIQTRLDEMAQNRTPGTELVLHDVRQQVVDFAKEHFAERGITLRKRQSLTTMRDEEARASGMKAADRANLRPTSGLDQTPELPA